MSNRLAEFAFTLLTLDKAKNNPQAKAEKKWYVRSLVIFSIALLLLLLFFGWVLYKSSTQKQEMRQKVHHIHYD